MKDHNVNINKKACEYCEKVNGKSYLVASIMLVHEREAGLFNIIENRNITRKMKFCFECGSKLGEDNEKQ